MKYGLTIRFLCFFVVFFTILGIVNFVRTTIETYNLP
ncbi:hypothetical protein LCGC14_1409890 [marine sediment metagenome]|uniref:Uncharacterized protein n=1 Tax=marine sediment metagenome TaxID=412755 RepID=A0A0F9JUW5_9ZZZZ